MRKLICTLLQFIASCGVLSAQSKPIDELRRMYDYDAGAPLDVREVKVIDRSGARIHDITYASPAGGRVTAYLVVPSGKGPFAGVVFGHWNNGKRTEFLPEALLYARAGVVSLMIDYPWVRPAPWRRFAPGTQPEAVRDNFVATVVDLRRAIDLLASRRDVARDRIAYVGHSSGAQWGAILSAVDDRVKAAVLMAGVPTEDTIMLKSDEPDQVEFRQNTPKEKLDAYLKVMSAFDAVNYVAHAAPTPLLFQFARYEQYFDEAAMLRYAQAASEPKTVRWYDAGHELSNVEALVDRARWLQKQIGMKSVVPILRKRMAGL